MSAKEQNINQWGFLQIFRAIFMIVALMFLYVGFSQLFLFDMHGVVYLALSQVFLYLVMLAVVFYVAVIERYNSFSAFFGLTSWPKNIIRGVFVFVLMVFFTTVVDLLFERFLGVKSADVYQGVDSSSLKYLSLVGVVFAPFAEEVFFRGFLQPVFVRSFGRALGISCVVLVFSMMHVAYAGNISALVGVVFVGLALSLAKEFSNSLIPSITAHFLNNLLAVWVLFYA